MIGFSSIDEVWDTQGFVTTKKETVSKQKQNDRSTGSQEAIGPTRGNKENTGNHQK